MKSLGSRVLTFISLAQCIIRRVALAVTTQSVRREPHRLLLNFNYFQKMAFVCLARHFAVAENCVFLSSISVAADDAAVPRSPRRPSNVSNSNESNYFVCSSRQREEKMRIILGVKAPQSRSLLLNCREFTRNCAKRFESVVPLCTENRSFCFPARVAQMANHFYSFFPLSSPLFTDLTLQRPHLTRNTNNSITSNAESLFY